jgi:hypothetical protein
LTAKVWKDFAGALAPSVVDGNPFDLGQVGLLLYPDLNAVMEIQLNIPRYLFSIGVIGTVAERALSQTDPGPGWHVTASPNFGCGRIALI